MSKVQLKISIKILKPSNNLIYLCDFHLFMARYEGSSRGRDNNGRKKFGGPRRRDSNRGRPNRSFEKTKVTCSSCGTQCEVPFKPTSSKPVYCSDCFSKKTPDFKRPSDNSLDVINEKLNKIMKALNIG